MEENRRKEITCIACPMGCKLSIQEVSEAEGGYLIEGYTCPKGKEYALQEMTDPRRMVTSTVRVEDGFLALVPVKTNRALPKELIFPAMEQINQVKLKAPVTIGQVVIANVCESGVDIVATRDMKKAWN